MSLAMQQMICKFALCAVLAAAAPTRICEKGWAGRDCSFFLGDVSDPHNAVSALEAEASTCVGSCSGNGRCVAGNCLCQPGFFGPICADKQCPSDCFSHGTCRQGACACHTGWMGKQCEFKAPSAETLAGSSQAASFLSAPQDVRRSATLLNEVSSIADQLRAAAAAQAGQMLEMQAKKNAEEERDAKLRIGRAVASAQRNSYKIPGHEFERKEPADLVQTGEQANGTKNSATSCTTLGCGGHGTCNSATGTCLCEKSHTGTLCDVKRCPDDCNGRGTCVMGRCVCGPAHFGTSCQSARCPGDCSGNGYCFNGACQCSGNYGGENCLLQLHSNNVVRVGLAHRKHHTVGGSPMKVSSLRASAVPFAGMSTLSTLQEDAEATGKSGSACQNGCSDSGQCIKGVCLCYNGFHGKDCAKVSACSGHGFQKGASLLQTNSSESAGCTCDAGWSGAKCDTELLCPDMTCSGHGICHEGKCACGVGYMGHACHISLISCEFRCGSHGSCMGSATNRCTCQEGWTGARCEIRQVRTCPGNGVCSGHGVCMNEGVNAVCSCEAKYEGVACDRMTSFATMIEEWEGKKKTDKTKTPASLLSSSTNTSAQQSEKVASQAKASVVAETQANATNNVKKASVVLSSNASSNASSNSTKAAQAVSAPITMSWMAPNSWVKPLPKDLKTTVVEVPAMSQPEVAMAMGPVTTVGKNGAVWHAAMLPMVAHSKPDASNKRRSILTLLSTGSTRQSEMTAPPRPSKEWKESPLEDEKQESPRKDVDIESLLEDI